MPIDYLQKILTAKVYDVAVESPLELAPTLSARLSNRVLLKREDQQSVFSFKLRGAYNKMAHLSDAERARGVIAASAGNHAQGVALAAQRLGCQATIVMPMTTPHIKVTAVEARGAKVVLHGDSYSDAYAKALELQKKTRATFVHPYDDPDVIAGQGTIGMEILRQWQGPLDAIFVAIGGGGLIAGVASYVKRVRPEVKIIGVQPVESDAMARSIAAGRRVTLPHVGLFADGVAVKQVGKETFRIARKLVDDIVLVDTDATCAALKDVFEDTRSILEPAGALAIAGVKAWVEKHRRERPDVRRDRLRREHELRPAALRRGARRGRRAARGAARGDDPRAAGQLPRVHRPHRQALGHRVQLPLRRPEGRAPVRRARGRRPARDAASSWPSSSAGASMRSTSPTTRWRSCTCATSSAAMRRRRRTRSCTASSFPSGRARC